MLANVACQQTTDNSIELTEPDFDVIDINVEIFLTRITNFGLDIEVFTQGLTKEERAAWYLWMLSSAFSGARDSAELLWSP